MKSYQIKFWNNGISIEDAAEYLKIPENLKPPKVYVTFEGA